MIFRRGMGRSYGEARTDGEEKGAGVVDAGKKKETRRVEIVVFEG